MKNIILTLLIALVSCSEELLLPKPDVSEHVDYTGHPKHALYQNAIENYQKQTSSPGVVMLIDRPGEDLWIGAAGYANLAHNTRMTTHTLVRTGSITKMFVAAVTMKMVDENKIKLDDAMSTWLPEIAKEIPGSDKITIKHLLGHLSGIVDPPNEDLNYQASIINDPVQFFNQDIKTLLRKYVYGKRLHFEPGSGYAYSNTNYWLLGLIIEGIQGETLESAMSAYIFEPLQLQHTYIERRDDKNLARGYVDFYRDGKLMDVSAWDRAEGDGKADGGLVTTAQDLGKFMAALFKGQLVSSESLQLMRKQLLTDCKTPECEYGLGIEIWNMDAGTAFGHNGSLIGIEANALYFEATGGIIVLYKNNGNYSDKRFLNDLMK